MTSGRIAVFLDRDGTLNEEVGFLDSLEKLIILPSAFEAVRLLNQHRLPALVITNQSGVARGLFDEAFVQYLHEHIRKIFFAQGAILDGFLYCPHHPTTGAAPYRQTCSCRKPEPGMLINAAQIWDIDLKHSYMIGDTLRDVETGQRSGGKGILVRTGYGKNQTLGETIPDYTASDVLEAVQWLLRDMERS